MESTNDLNVNVDAEFKIVCALHEEIEQFLARSDAGLNTVVPQISGWSVAMQLEHVLKANTMVTSGLVRLLDGSLEEKPAGQISRIGKIILGRGSIPRGKAQAPDSFRPSPDTPIDTLRDQNRTCCQRLEILGKQLVAIQQTQDGFDHPYFGTLSASVWMRFLHVHTRHHLNIVSEILAAMTPSSAAANGN